VIKDQAKIRDLEQNSYQYRKHNPGAPSDSPSKNIGLLDDTPEEYSPYKKKCVTMVDKVPENSVISNYKTN
jgi:hypothetical protein